MTAAADVAVIGGGVIGLSVAWELAGRGARVAVLDGGPPGPSASWAGAGMLAPVPQRVPADPWGAFRAESLALHPAWSERLRAETGLDNGYRLCGGIDVAMDDADSAALERRRPLWEAEGVPAERLCPEEAAKLEPELTGFIRSAYHFPGRAQVRNPWHLGALAEGCRRRGVSVYEGNRVEEIVARGGRVEAVVTSSARVACGAAVVAAGPWTSRLVEPLGIDAPTPPLRGQIVLLRWDRPRLRRIVERGHEYLVPRDDGRVLVGSTEEWAGFDPRPTATGVAGLLRFALALCPGLGEAELERAWAGLRPASRDGRPYIGLAPGHDNLYLAAGHRRIGVQLAPGTAMLVADLVTGATPRWDPAAFALGREAAGAVSAFES